MDDNYDVVIVGAGPAGLFATIELIKKNKKVLLIDKGKLVNDRFCPLKNAKGCQHCKPCNVVSGIGGAGAFSDGKLTLTPEYGGNLEEYCGREELIKLISEVDNIYIENGATDKLFKPDEKTKNELQYKALQNNIEIIPATIRHMGTDKSKEIINNIYNKIVNKCTVIHNVKVDIDCVLKKEQNPTFKKRFKFQYTKDNTIFRVDTDNVVFAVGREGSPFMNEVAQYYKLTTIPSNVDIGVRVEIPNCITKDITDKFYELKAVYNTITFDDKVRTFCMCPDGEVTTEYQNQQEILTVNGHSNREKNKTNNTNFAILVSSKFTKPFNDTIGYGSHIARLANMLSGGIIVQRLGDLLKGRRTNEERLAKSLTKPTLKTAVPGDLSYVLPYRYIVDIIEMLKALDSIMPGIYNPNTLLYGVEVKFYSLKIKLNSNLMSEINGIYCIGDGAGVTRGVIQASASGIWCAKNID